MSLPARSCAKERYTAPAAVTVTTRGRGSSRAARLEPGETDEAALIREIREELGIEVTVEELLGTLDHDYPEFHMNMRLYICRHVSGEPELRVHSEGRWLGLQDLYTVRWFEADAELIRRLEAYLR